MFIIAHSLPYHLVFCLKSTILTIQKKNYSMYFWFSIQFIYLRFHLVRDRNGKFHERQGHLFHRLYVSVRWNEKTTPNQTFNAVAISLPSHSNRKFLSNWCLSIIHSNRKTHYDMITKRDLHESIDQNFYANNLPAFLFPLNQMIANEMFPKWNLFVFFFSSLNFLILHVPKCGLDIATNLKL